MKIMVTGGAGFVGSNICKKILMHGHDVIAVDNLKFGSIENVRPLIALFPTRFKFQNFPFELIGGPHFSDCDLLVHAATDNIIYAMKNREEVIRNNACETISLFNRFPRHIIYLSTASVYGNAEMFPTPEFALLQPSEIYSQTKLLVEDYLQMRGNFTTLRLSNVYGPNQRPESQYCGVIGKVLNSILSGKEVNIIGNGKQTRDFTYVEDVAEAVLLAIKREPLNTEINIATGVETCIWDIIHYFNQETWSTQLQPARAIDNIERRCLSIRKAWELLLWRPKHYLGNGLFKTAEWLKANYNYEKTDTNN